MTSWRGVLARKGLGAATLSLLAFCVVCDFLFARVTRCTSDSVQNFNELHSIASGNFLLHDWYLATDNFYFTDLPFYVFFRLIFGATPALIWLIPFFVFLFFLAGCILIVRRAGATEVHRHLGTMAVIVLAGFPFLPAQALLLQSAIHGATIALSIWGLVIAQRLLTGPPGPLSLLLPYMAIVMAVAGSDPQADVYFMAPLLLLVPFRAWLHGRFFAREWMLLACTLAGAGLGICLIGCIGRRGGFQLSKNYSMAFVPDVPALWHNARAMALALQIAFDARPVLLQGLAGHRSIAVARFATLLAVLALCLRTVWRAPRGADRAVTEWLVLGAFCLAAADAISGIFAGLVADGPPDLPYIAVRYVIPVYIFAALAAVLEGQALFGEAYARLGRTASAAAVCLGAAFLVAAAQEAVKDARLPLYIQSAPQYRLAIFLAAHDLSYGIGDYWTTQMVTALSNRQVVADPVLPVAADRLAAVWWCDDVSQMNAGRKPEFVVFTPVNQWNITLGDVVQTYGQPAAVISYEGYVIAVLKH